MEKINRITHDLNHLGDNLVGSLDKTNKNISESLGKSTEDIKRTSENIITSAITINESLKTATEDIHRTSENISASAETMAETLSQASLEIKETAGNIAQSADTIAGAVKEFTTATSETISRIERSIENSVSRLVSAIEDFKSEIVGSGIKVNIARSAGSLVPQTSVMQGITTGIRDMIIPKRTKKDTKE